VTDLADRMRTCAAHIIANDAHDRDDGAGLVLRDAAALLIEAAGALEAPVPGWSDHQQWREALEIIAGRRQSIDNLMSNQDIAIAALAVLGEPVPIIKPVGADGARPADHIPPQTGTWIAPGGPLPYAAALEERSNPRACPKCDSRAWKRVSHQGNQVMLTCGACGTKWVWSAP